MGTTLTLNAAPAAGIDIFIVTTQDDFYRLGTVIYSEGALPTQELERVDRGELYHLLSSKLTAPTTTYPIYIYERQKAFCISFNNSIRCSSYLHKKTYGSSMEFYSFWKRLCL